MCLAAGAIFIVKHLTYFRWDGDRGGYVVHVKIKVKITQGATFQNVMIFIHRRKSESLYYHSIQCGNIFF